MRIIQACILTMMCACETAQRLPEKVEVPVPVTCIERKDIPEVSFKSEAELKAMNRYHRTLIVWSERIDAISAFAKARAQLIACAR